MCSLMNTFEYFQFFGIQNISKVKVREEADLNKRMLRKFSLKMRIY